MELPPTLNELPTPTLVLRRDLFDTNLQTMAKHCAEHNLALRPHAKTHKSAQIAQLQIDAGAVGICCATLSEAEILGSRGIQDILVTSPVVSESALNRLAQLNQTIANVACVVDHADNLKAIQGVFANRKPLKVLCDLDPGMHRTGAPLNDHTIELISSMVDSAEVKFEGVQIYAGNLMHVSDLRERKDRTATMWEQTAEFLRQLKARGISCNRVSGGGTGTHDLDWRSGVLTELQAGSYPFMDRDYLDIEWKADQQSPFQSALFVLTSVVSSNTPGLATTDAGLKAFATDSGLPRIYGGIEGEADYFFMGDEHGGVRLSDMKSRLSLDTHLLVIPPHCDPTINLYNEITIVDEHWIPQGTFTIDARSGNQLAS